MLNLAIIGCGAVVDDLHVPPLQKLAGRGYLKVTALIDPNSARLSKLQGAFPKAKLFATPEEAFAAGKIDLTLIASPPGLHISHGLAAIQAGSHVFTEKPMVTCGADAEKWVSAAAVAKRLLAVGLPRRYFPHFAEVAELVRAGELGRELTFSYREGGAYKWPVASDAPFRRKTSGGGVLMDKGVHSLDTMDQLFGKIEVLESADDSLRDGVESNVRLRLRYPESNARGSFQLSWDQPLNNGLRIDGDLGSVCLGIDDICVYKRRKAGGAWQEVRATKTWPSTLDQNSRQMTPNSYYDCIFLQLIGVLRAIELGESPAVDGAAARRVICAIEHAYATARPLDLPWLAEGERSALTAKHWRA